MGARWTRTALTQRLGIELPIVLGPFGGASSVALTAAVSNGGGLGSYGLYGMSGAAITKTATDLRAATDAPFALNLWLPLGDDERRMPDEETFQRYLAPLADLFAQAGLPLPKLPERFLVPFDEQLDAAIDARPRVLSFVYGVPSPRIIERARTVGALVVGTATTSDEAVALEAGGVDAIVATGSEAAGHRVSFLRSAEDSLVGTLALVPQVVDSVNVPVIAAGGIADGRGVAAALALGASGAQLGTAFLACDDSAASAPHRDALWSEAAAETVLTRVFSGRLARGIPNRMTRQLDEAAVAPFPAENWLTGHLKRAAAQTGNRDMTSLWAGQAAPLVRHHRAADLLAAIRQTVGDILP